ncbi:Uncharacterised protein [Vibrio cholerae]|nr:Uncharacterised protein [Vibrio cholerae]
MRCYQSKSVKLCVGNIGKVAVKSRWVRKKKVPSA